MWQNDGYENQADSEDVGHKQKLEKSCSTPFEVCSHGSYCFISEVLIRPKAVVVPNAPLCGKIKRHGDEENDKEYARK